MRQRTKVKSWYELRMRTKSDTPGGPDDHGWNETLKSAKQNVERALRDYGYKVKKERSK